MKEKYDVVIVGTGVAGCFAALHLSENMDVLMITKGDLEESDSFLAQGGKPFTLHFRLFGAFNSRNCGIIGIIILIICYG